jgi:nickel/cobalt transporter (NiCoT) family protein
MDMPSGEASIGYGICQEAGLTLKAYSARGMCALLLVGNATVWLWALALFGSGGALIGSAALAYLLGLRHAVDADHIAAIDNVTRKLVQQGQDPVAVGLYFALGHSSVVMLACIAIAATGLRADFEKASRLGGLIGTEISAFFLVLIALANVAALGFLFGLGFDTASSVGILSLSSLASHAVTLGTVAIFPALFTAGMTLIDTTDGLLMKRAYGWALISPRRKLVYNLTITSFSILVALVIGGLEILSLIRDRFSLSGWFFTAISKLNAHFGFIGCIIAVALAAIWVGAAFMARPTSPLPDTKGQF